LQRLGFERQSKFALLLSLPPQAVVLAHKGESERAVELLGLALSYPSSMTGWMEKWPLLTRLQTNLETELGTAKYAAAGGRGQAMTLDQAVPFGRDRRR